MMDRNRFTHIVAVFLTVSCLLVCSSAARAEDDHPIIKLVKEGTKESGKPFTLIVVLQAKEGKVTDLEAAFVPAIKGTRKEKGCIHYELNRDTSKPGRYMMYERWKTIADLEAHLKTAHIAELAGKLGDLTAGPPEFRVMVPAAE